MAKKFASRAMKPAEFESEAAESDQKTITKAEGVRRALAQGLEKPGDIADFLKTEFGLEVGNQQISTYKTLEKARQARQEESGPAKRGPKPKAAVERIPAPAPTSSSPKPAGDEGELLSAMEAMKPLVDSLGVDKVKRIVELLG